MRKKTTTLFSLLLCAATALGQSYPFEYGYTGWSATNGTLSLSSDHQKQGTNSLCWETSGTSQLEVSGFNVTTSANNCANMFIYSRAITNDTLVVEFMHDDKVEKTGNFLFNFKGWHEFKRWYKSYENTSNVALNRVRFTLKPTSNDVRKIYFDDAKLNEDINTSKDILGSHWILDFDVLEWVGNRLDPHYLKDPYRLAANPRDIPITTPTADELAALAQFRKAYKPVGKYWVTATKNAIAYTQALNITYNADGTIHGGKVIPTGSTTITLDPYIENDQIMKHLVNLSGAVYEGKGSADAEFEKLFDYAIDQGLGEGAPIFASSNAYDDVRGLTSAWKAIVVGCKDPERYDQALRALRWFSYYGALYNPEESYLNCINSDVLYLLVDPMMAAIACEKDDATAVRELKAFKRYLERSVSDVPGVSNMIKIDGTGFHHGVHYVNYMRAYAKVTDAMKGLKGTPFKVNAEAYENFRKAVLTIFACVTKSNADAHSYALSLCGRHPFAANHSPSYEQSNFEDLVAIGRDCYGTDKEPIAEGAYNYYYESDKYDVPATPYEGFYQYNYAPMGIYRQDDWVITMRSPTTAFFTAEIYSSTNRFGRYQGHGTIDVNYSGSNFGASGYPTTTDGGGWDWNCPVGGTTVHFTNWKYLMPKGNTSQRHDQHANSDFSGGLSFGKSGMYGCEYIQRESWTATGSSSFPGYETYLQYKKSMFCFDGMVIAMGSNIGSFGSYPSGMITATTLFQEVIKAPTTTPLVVNDVQNFKGYNNTLQTSGDNWFVTPIGTGYFVPKGNNDIVVKYDDQTTPQHTGKDVASPTTTVTAAKAYLNHGYKTANNSYNYVVKPNATADDMKALATQVNSGSLYEVKSQDASMHAIYYKPQNTMAYSFFTAKSDLEFGIVKASSAPCLLMNRADAETGNQYFAICDPNLHPKDDHTSPVNFEVLFYPSSTTLTLKGELYPLEEVEGVQFSEPSNGTTTVTVAMSDGLPTYFGMATTPPASTPQTEMEAWVTMREESEKLVFDFASTLDASQVTIYSLEGKGMATVKGSAAQASVTVTTSHIPSGVYICRVTVGDNVENIKWIKE